VATPLVSLHVAPDGEGLAATRVRALERLLARVGVAVDPEGAGSREGLVAGLANVPILALRERGGRLGRDVVVVLPRVGARRGSEANRHGHGRELLRKRSLVVETRNLGLRRRRRLHGRIVGRQGRLRHVGRSGEGLLGIRSLDRHPVLHDGSHVSGFFEGRSRLVIVVVAGNDRETADRLRGGGRIAIERSLGAHGRRRWHSSPHHGRLRVVC